MSIKILFVAEACSILWLLFLFSSTFGFPEITNNLPFFISTMNLRPSQASTWCISLHWLPGMPFRCLLSWSFFFLHLMLFYLGEQFLIASRERVCERFFFFFWDISFLNIPLFSAHAWLTFWLDTEFWVGNNFIRISIGLLYCCLVSIVSVKMVFFISSLLKFHDEAKNRPGCQLYFHLHLFNLDTSVFTFFFFSF